MRIHHSGCLILIAANLFAVSATAQTSTSGDGEGNSAAKSAEDAFGASAGINQVGLYSPYSTRGFDLIATGGAFRVNGFYFHPAALPTDSLVSGSSMNVGIAATALDLPSPTGVVAYRLREPGDRSSLSLTVGSRGFGSPSIEAFGTLVSNDRQFGLAAHTFVSPNEKWATGQNGSRRDAAAVAAWTPGAATKVRIFGEHSRQSYNGDVAVLPVAADVPPPLPRRHNYGADWARVRTDSSNMGILVEHRSGDWSFGGAAVRSARGSTRADTTVLEIDRDGEVTSTLYHTPEADARSTSIELKSSRAVNFAGMTHRIGAAFRQRSSISSRAEAISFPAGDFSLSDGPIDIARPDLPRDAPQSRDEVSQRILSGTYDLAVGSRFQLRLGAHRNRYEKSFRNALGDRSRKFDRSWLYSGSVLWTPASRLHLFASYVSGIEESGVAPELALNRGAVLPPVKARQYEAGLRFDLTPRLGLILAGFDIRKPIYGLRSDSIYAPVGTVRHRGVEASLTGQLTPSTTIVLGANYVQPRMSGELVDAGGVNAVAPGVSRFNGTIAIEQSLAQGWSADAYLLYEGRRRRDNRTDVEVDGVPLAIVGTTYDWKLRRTRQSLRLQLINALNRNGYYATPYGALVPITAQHWRVLLTTRL